MAQETFNSADFNGMFGNKIYTAPLQLYEDNEISYNQIYDIIDEMVDWMQEGAIKKQAFVTLMHKVLDNKMGEDVIHELCECLSMKIITKPVFIKIMKSFFKDQTVKYKMYYTETDPPIISSNDKSITNISSETTDKERHWYDFTSIQSELAPDNGYSWDGCNLKADISACNKK